MCRQAQAAGVRSSPTKAFWSSSALLRKPEPLHAVRQGLAPFWWGTAALKGSNCAIASLHLTHHHPGLALISGQTSPGGTGKSMNSTRAFVPARMPASEATASWGCAGNKAPFVTPRLGAPAAGTLLAAPAAGPCGRKAGTISSSPSDAFGTLGKVGHCVLFCFQEAAERQAQEARKSEQFTLLHLPQDERKIPSPLWRRCSGTAGFKELVLNLIKKPLMLCWLPVHPSSAALGAAELAGLLVGMVQLPVPSPVPLGQGPSQAEAAQAGHAAQSCSNAKAPHAGRQRWDRLLSCGSGAILGRKWVVGAPWAGTAAPTPGEGYPEVPTTLSPCPGRRQSPPPPQRTVLCQRQRCQPPLPRQHSLCPHQSCSGPRGHQSSLFLPLLELGTPTVMPSPAPAPAWPCNE